MYGSNMNTKTKIKRAVSKVHSKIHPKATLKRAGSLVDDLQEVLTAARDVYDAIYKHTHGKSVRQGAVAVSRAWNKEMHGDVQGSTNGKATRRGGGAKSATKRSTAKRSTAKRAVKKALRAVGRGRKARSR